MVQTESEKKFIAELEATPLKEARRKIASGDFGAIGSTSHTFVSSWLVIKEAEARDAREAETSSIAKEANSRTSAIDRFTRRAVLKDRIIAIAAVIIAAIAAREEIRWFISWLIRLVR
jgi:hypothetical protein